jgi:hypothetical protein
MKIPTTMMTESVPARNAVAGSQSWLPTIVIAMAQIPESPPILRISARYLLGSRFSPSAQSAQIPLCRVKCQ